MSIDGFLLFISWQSGQLLRKKMQSSPSILNDIFIQGIKAATSYYFYNHFFYQLVVLFSQLSLT